MSPYDWGDLHRGNLPQFNKEDAGQTPEEKAIAEDRSRGLRVPGIKPGKLMGEKDSERGMPASDPRGLVFDHESGALRPVSDDDYKKPTKGTPATEKQQDAMEQSARRPVVDRK